MRKVAKIVLIILLCSIMFQFFFLLFTRDVEIINDTKYTTIEELHAAYKEEINKNMNTTIEEVREVISSRDYKDSVINKALVRTNDSILVDTTNTTVEEAVQKVLDLAKERINNGWGSSSVYW